MGVERMCFIRDLIPSDRNDRDGYSGHKPLWASGAAGPFDVLNHAKDSLGAARVLSQLLFMVNADNKLDHEALLRAVIALVDDDVLAKMLSPLLQDKSLLDVTIGTLEKKLSSEQELKEAAEAQISRMLSFERERYDRLADMEPMPQPSIFSRLCIESWYYTEEDEALLHLKLDHFLAKCDIIKEDSTLDGVLQMLVLPEDFASLPVALVKMAIQRRIYRLEKLASIEPYKKFLREVISKIVVEGGQSFNQSKYFLSFLDHKPSQFLEGRDKDPFLDELRCLAEKYSLAGCEYILEGSLDHCRTVLSMSSSAGEIDQALEKFVEELKRGVESQWFDNHSMCPAYLDAVRKLQLEMEPRGESLNQQLYVHRCLRSQDHKVEEDVDKEVTEVLPIASRYFFSLEDFGWVRNVAIDAMDIDEKLQHVNCTKISRSESALANCIWKRVDLLHKELVLKVSASCLFFFEILRGMRLPDLTDIFRNIRKGKDDDMTCLLVEKKLKKMGLADVVLNNLEKLKANVPANLRGAHDSNIRDSWQAFDLDLNSKFIHRDLEYELRVFANAFGCAIKHMKGLKDTANIASQFNDQSSLECVKQTLEGYQDSYRREHRLREDINRMTKQKDAASGYLSNLCYVEMVQDSIEEAAKEELVLKEEFGAYGCDTVDWWNYRRLDQAKLEENTSIDSDSDIEPLQSF